MREEIVRRHIEGGESYRAIALWMKRLTEKKTSPLQLQKIFQDYAVRCKTAYEMSVELRPKWNGIVLLDEKMCVVKGTRQWFYLAVDTTGDILHCCPVVELSSTEAIKFLKEVLTLPVNVHGVVTDLDPSLTRAVSVVCAEIPHQYCIKHALAAIGVLIGYAEMNVRRGIISSQRYNNSMLTHQSISTVYKRKRLYSLNSPDLKILEHLDSKAALFQASKKILTAKTEERSLSYLNTLRRSKSFSSAHQTKVVRFFRRHWKKLMMHHRVDGIPRTTNMVENVNKQLQRRYKSIEAFQYTRTAIDYTKLLIAFLRQKSYTDCRGNRKHLNGKSRLASAKVKNLDPNWLKNSIKNTVK